MPKFEQGHQSQGVSTRSLLPNITLEALHSRNLKWSTDWNQYATFFKYWVNKFCPNSILTNDFKEFFLRAVYLRKGWFQQIHLLNGLVTEIKMLVFRIGGVINFSELKLNHRFQRVSIWGTFICVNFDFREHQTGSTPATIFEMVPFYFSVDYLLKRWFQRILNWKYLIPYFSNGHLKESRILI